jgi:penicillin amidase
LLLAASSLPGCSDEPALASPRLGPLGERSDLPVDGRIDIAGLSAPVDVVRDQYGRPHVYATTLADAMRVEGYLVAVDRTVQLDLLRRTAEGRLAEVLGDLSTDIIDQDILYRHVGLTRIATAQYAALSDPEIRGALDAYADGITQVFRRIRAGELEVPAPLVTYPLEAFEDWTAVDSLTVARLQSYLLSYTVNNELYYEQLLTDVQTTFSPQLVDPQLARRAGFERDLWRMAPLEPAFTSSKAPTLAPGQGGAAEGGRHRAAPHAQAVQGYLRAMERVSQALAPEGFGSNSWVVAPSRSATGHALLANDPHLSLVSPPVFWPVSLHVGAAGAGLHAAGVAFPGIPGIILGHNERIAWGATVAGYDVADIYAEKLSPDGQSVVFQGKNVPLQTVKEVIAIRNREPLVYNVKIVPHHGPIIPTIVSNAVVDPDPATGALSVRWTGHEPTREIEAVFSLMRAGSVDDARAALGGIGTGAQNWLVGDVAGDILWTTHASVPLRAPASMAWDPAKYVGDLPCLVLPGGGSAEWQGYLADDLVPWDKNPAKGAIISANNDPLGFTADGNPTNDSLPDGTPVFLSCDFDPGVRAARIETRLDAASGPLSPQDMAAIQGDVRSALGARLVPFLLDAFTRGEEERATPGMHPDLTAVVSDSAYDPARIAAIRAQLEAWGAEADYLAASGIDPDTGKPLAAEGNSPSAVEARAARATLVFNTWLIRLLRRTFGDEYVRMKRADLRRNMQLTALVRLVQNDPQSLATYDAATGESAIWDDLDTPAIETRHERALRAMLDAIAWLDTEATGNAAAWGAHHVVRMAPSNPLWSGMAIPAYADPLFGKGFPRHGDMFSVDASDYRASQPLENSLVFDFAYGPVQRIVVDLDPQGPRAWNAIPGGAVWDPDSPHFDDEAALWRKNTTHAVPFRVEDVVAAKESRFVLSSR